MPLIERFDYAVYFQHLFSFKNESYFFSRLHCHERIFVSRALFVNKTRNLFSTNHCI